MRLNIGGTNFKGSAMKQVDIYVERASTNSTIHTVELDRETGLYTPNFVRIGLGGIRRAQRLRKERIAEWKSEGLVVKGCNDLVSVREELFESLYKPGYTVQSNKELYDFYDAGHIFFICGNLQSVGEFQNLALSFLHTQIALGKIQLAIRVSNVKA